MELFQILRLWMQLERCTAGVKRVSDRSATVLSVTSSGAETMALTWRSDDPLAVRVNVLEGLGTSTAVTSREALRAAARSGFGRTCRLVVHGRTLRPHRAQVRRLLDATDTVVTTRQEVPVVDAAAEVFLHAVLGPVAPTAS